MTIAVGADHGGYALKSRIIAHLGEQGHQVLDLGTSSDEAVDYPVFARAVAEAVASGRALRGIMIDGAGIGSAMVANKIPGARAALAYDLSSARNSREHNDANVLTLGAGLIGSNLALQIVDAFLGTDCREERHLRRVAMISALDVDRKTGTPRASAAVSGAAVGSGGAATPVSLDETDLRRIIDRVGTLWTTRAGAGTGGGGATQRGTVAGDRSASATGEGPLLTGRGRKTSSASVTAEHAAGAPLGGAELAAMIDHTILRPDATRDDVLKICAEAREYRFKAVCVHPCWVHVVNTALRGSGVVTCTVVGFPLGASAPDTKALEARRAIREGAREIDMVINIGALKGGEDEAVLRDIRTVVEACRDGSARCKVIIETALLTDEEKIRACHLARRARAHFVKTSTGFAKGGATAEDVALMAAHVRAAGLEVKASGGIRTAADARRMVAAGASRLGTSGSVAIVREAGVATVGAA